METPYLSLLGPSPTFLLPPKLSTQHLTRAQTHPWETSVAF